MQEAVGSGQEGRQRQRAGRDRGRGNEEGIEEAVYDEAGIKKRAQDRLTEF